MKREQHSNHEMTQRGKAATNGARLCEPQHGGNRGRGGSPRARFQAEALRVTDPRSDKFAEVVKILIDSSYKSTCSLVIKNNS